MLCGLLIDSGMVVSGADIGECKSSGLRCSRYVSCDVSSPNEELSTLAQQSDCILLCLPETIVLSALEIFSSMAAPGALIVDTLSIKTPLVGIVGNVRTDVQHLSINPMFAPDVGFFGQNVVATPIIDGPECMIFVSMMEKWGSNVVLMSAEEHDKQTAITQVATHAAILAFGSCLDKLGYDAEKGLSISTPPNRMLLALLVRIASKDPEVYWEIQTDNPFAGQARAALLDSLREIDDMVKHHDREAFHDAIVGNRKLLAPVFEKLQELSARLIKNM